MRKPEDMPFGYGRMVMNRTEMLKDLRIWIERAAWVNERTPMPWREYSPMSQFTDMLRYDSTAEMQRMLIIARCIAQLQEDLYAKVELLQKMVQETARKNIVLNSIHERESGEAWRGDDYERRGR